MLHTEMKRMTDEPAIRLVRPLQIEYIIIGGILMNYQNEIYTMSEDQFIKLAMTKSNGSMNPNRVKLIFALLMQEAGLTNVNKNDAKQETRRPE